jgi:hypothetical protein
LAETGQDLLDNLLAQAIEIEGFPIVRKFALREERIDCRALYGIGDDMSKSG